MTANYMLPSGEIVTIQFDDKYDTRYGDGKSISFTLRGGKVVIAIRVPDAKA